MATSYNDLLSRIDALQARADVARKQEAARVIKQVRATIETYGLTAEDLGLVQPKEPRGSTPTRKAPSKTTGPTSPSGRPYSQVKYQDDQGHAWSGRGPKPAWLRAAIASGKPIGDFEVKGVDGATGAGRKADVSRAKRPVKVKWKDDAGHTWAGRGNKPAWFKAALEAGKTLAELAA